MPRLTAGIAVTGGLGNVGSSGYRAGMDDLAELAAAVTGFAAAENMTVVPTVPEHDCGPEVCLGPDEMGLPGGS